MYRGYIKLWRKSVDNPLYFSEPFTKWQAWVDLLLLANHKNATVSVRGIIVHLDRGQVMAGEDFLATRWKWSRGKVRNYLAYLSSKNVQQIVQQKDNVCGVITVCNYNTYTSSGTADCTAECTADSTPNCTTESQQKDIPKNVQNKENDKNDLFGGFGEVEKASYGFDPNNFIERFNASTGKRFRVLDEKTRRQLNARLKEGFTVDEIIKAAVTCKADPYHIENPKHLTPEFITRADKLQIYLNASTAKPKAGASI